MKENIELSVQNFKKHMIFWDSELEIRIQNYGILISPKLAEHLGKSITVGFDKDNNKLVLQSVDATFMHPHKITKNENNHYYIKSLRLGKWILDKGFEKAKLYKMIFNEQENCFITIEGPKARIIPIGCKPNCRGEGYPCIQDICKIIKNGDVAFMMYAHHVFEKIKTMDFLIEVKKQNDIPIGMYISEKGALSVYERFKD